MVKIALVAVVVFVALLLILEISLRSLFGFGDPLLYIPDDTIGYLLAPNQRVRRFGNRIEINQYFMRGAPITPTRSPHTLRILLLGDSVANGGWWTDQADIISEILTQQLRAVLSTPTLQTVEVLNASANSWCPRNEFAYLQRFGTFDSQIIILLINTDDLFGTAPTSIPVGRDPNYPDHKPVLALVEVFTRYVVRYPAIPELQAVQSEGGDRVGFNLEAIRRINTLMKQTDGQVILAMTPLLREVKSEPRDYELKARQRLQELTEQDAIPYVDFLPIFKTVADPQQLYQDHIHLSPMGNQHVSQTLVATVMNRVNRQ